MELASLVLENNYFEFNDEVFQQKLGKAKGTKFAPAYAYLFMSRLEERLLDSWDNKPLVWMRYIDDIFFYLDTFSFFIFILHVLGGLPFSMTDFRGALL